MPSIQFTQFDKPAFSIIGMEGSTGDGDGFIPALWQRANSRFAEIAHLAKTDDGGVLCGLFGAMTDFSRSFQPWQNGFSQGLYLAGVECVPAAVPPPGWVRWDLPAFRFLSAENGEGVFAAAIKQLEQDGITLAGAVQEYTNPADGREYLWFPIQRLS